jgi:hydroxymethylpyrimidine pyrophosphatase-like HAD family hydrolase
VPTVELVVTDLDGTFWYREGDLHEQPHPTSLDAWRALEDRGIPVVVATGRRLGSSRDPLGRLGLTPPLVVLNGALVVDLPAGGRRVHRHDYADGQALDVLAEFRAVGVEPCVYVDHEQIDVFFGTAPSTHPEHLGSFGRHGAEHDLDTVVAEHPVFMFGVMGHHREPFDELARRLGDTAEVHIAPDQWGGFSCTVGPVGLSKWDGVVAYCEHAGIDPARVLAIGDGPNDVDLLEHAAVAVVPACGHDPALAVADHVVRRTRDGGWADVLDLV